MLFGHYHILISMQMVWIDENQDGLVDVQNLERKLKVMYSNIPQVNINYYGGMVVGHIPTHPFLEANLTLTQPLPKPST